MNKYIALSLLSLVCMVTIAYGTYYQPAYVYGVSKGGGYGYGSGGGGGFLWFFFILIIIVIFLNGLGVNRGGGGRKGGGGKSYGGGKDRGHDSSSDCGWSSSDWC